MIICDICRKAPVKTGPGSHLYRLSYAFNHPDNGFTLHFVNEDSSDAKFAEQNSAICGNCLKRLGVDKLLAEDIKRNREREHRARKFDDRLSIIQASPRSLPPPEDN